MFAVMRQTAAIAVTAALSAACAFGAPVSPAATKTNAVARLEALKGQYAKALSQIQETNLFKSQDALTSYGKGLDSAMASLKASLKKQGNLEAFLLAQEEKKRFEASKTVPPVGGQPEVAELDRLAGEYKKATDAARDSNVKSTLALNKRFELAWDAFVKESVQAGEIELAKKAKEELTRVRGAIASAAAEPGAAVNPSPAADEPAAPAQKKGLLPFLQKGLVLCYSFDRDENGKVTDRSGRGNHGKNHDAKWVARGKAGSGCRFAGGSESGEWIEVEDSASLSSPQRTRQLSICLWMKPVSLPLFNPELVSKGGDLGGSYVNDGYDLYINHNGALGFCSGVRSAYTSTQDFAGSIDEWTHVAVTVDAADNKVMFFVNGKAAPDTMNGEWSRANFAVHNKCYIGGPDPKANPNRSWFNGSMDEVMIFSRALTAEEVTRIYEAQK